MGAPNGASDGLLAFRRRAVSVAGRTLAVGLPLLAIVLELTSPIIVATDVVVLLVAAAVHGAAAATVGRRWEPGGLVCLGYLLVTTALISIFFIHASTPQSDSFWFLLIPVGLSGVTMPRRLHALVTGFGLVLYPVMTALGPGLDVPLTASRLVSMALFGLAVHGIARRLEQALLAAGTARAALADQLDEVRRLNEQLTELDRAKDLFVSTVSHELRTPLTIIQGLTGTLEDHWEGLGEDQRRELTRRVGANTRALRGIVATLLDLARIERGGLEALPEPVPLRRAVDEALDRLGPLLEAHDVVVEVDPATVVVTDLRLLERVLDNLLVNASRHTGAGTQVLVRGRADDSGVRVEVADDGPGVSAEELARLGEEFYRAGDAEDRDADGIGLGLVLVREVLAALDTRLEVASQPDRGMTFSFVLPAAAEVARVTTSGQSGTHRT